MPSTFMPVTAAAENAYWPLERSALCSRMDSQAPPTGSHHPPAL